MTTRIDPRLERLLGGTARQALRRRLRRLLVRGGTGPVRLDRLDESDHVTLAAILGRPPRATRSPASMTLDLDAIDAAFVRAGVAASLRDALEQLDGPIVDRRAERQARGQAWVTVFTAPGPPPLMRLLADAAGQRLLRRLARLEPGVGEQLRDQAMAVLARLPADGVPRSMLAASVLGDAHGLDDGRPVATLVLAAWRLGREGGAACGEGEAGALEAEVAEADVVDGEAADADAADAAAFNVDVPAAEGDGIERNRDVWADAGVLVNALARPALVLNLPSTAEGASIFAAGAPGYLSLRQLVRTPPSWRLAGETVFVCENPNVIAWAADRLGPACAPLVCTDGMPAAAQRLLLSRLAAAGASLRYHGDFDWPGLRIANLMVRRFGAQPWRMQADDYRQGLALAGEYSHPLAGEPAEAIWDEALAPAMRLAGIAIAEETLAATLLADLEV